MTRNVRRLGRGLSSLIAPELAAGEAASDEQPPGISSTNLPDSLRGLAPSPRFAVIPLTRIRQNPMQPRRDFDDQALRELADSLRTRGAIQPIVVRPSDGGYELIAGERRLRAAQLADIHEIPCIIRSSPDEEMLELALIENIHRQDLNPIERALAYKYLHTTYGLSHEQIAERVGEDRATATNYIRLLSLPDAVQQMVAGGKLTAGHAKAILGLVDSSRQTELAQRVVRQNWSVRRLEAAVAAAKKSAESPAAARQIRPPVADLELRLSAALKTRVRIHEGRRRHTGRVVIEYYSLDDFQRITERLGVTEETL